MSRIYEFVQVDVFTKTPLMGNPLAVFADARGLTDREMQALAREMNLSETTFILPREPEIEAEKGTRVRIFTVAEELPFAGHPTLGTALYLYSTASSALERVSLDLNVGKIDISFRGESKSQSRTVNGTVFGEMRQRDPEFGKELPREEIGTAIRDGADVIASEWPCQVVSTGFPFAIVPIRDVERLSNLQVDLLKMNKLLEAAGGRFCYFIAPESEQGEMRARMFMYGQEDPATGSAAGCAIGWMVRHGLVKSDEQILIRQGVEAGRPSEIFVRASLKDEKVTDVRVGGYAAEVLRGTVNLE